MVGNEIKNEKICTFYVSDYHFEIISLPYISKNLENKNEVIILTENDLEGTIKNLLPKINIKDNKKENILKLDWQKNDIEKLKIIEENINNNKKTTIFVKGKEKYINKINKDISKLNKKDSSLKIINCYDIQEVGENLEQIMSQYNIVLSTEGEKEIEKI